MRPTFVLVPGGWVGGWAWKEVAALLRSSGYEVFTPTLTGLGERVHLLNREVGLETHITDILNLIHYEALHNVVIVGWSYGGIVITGVVDRIPELICHVVYLDAFVPENGESGIDLMGSEFSTMLRNRAETLGEGWRIPHEPIDADRRTDHPLKTLLDVTTIGNSKAAFVPRTYIRCIQTNFANLPANAERAQKKEWNYYELDSGHEPIWTMPDAVANILKKVADGV